MSDHIRVSNREIFDAVQKLTSAVDSFVAKTEVRLDHLELTRSTEDKDRRAQVVATKTNRWQTWSAMGTSIVAFIGTYFNPFGG